MLPKHADAKKHRPAWSRPVSVAIPGVPARRLRLRVPNIRPRRVAARPLLLAVAAVVLVVLVVVLRAPDDDDARPPPPPAERSTLVFRREQLQRIWRWEIASGHFPSARAVPRQIALQRAPPNPALPSQGGAGTHGVGPRRTYLDVQSAYPDVAYPPRPVPGSIADMDIIMDHCDFSANKYVRDCLEVLRVGGGLDNGRRTRRGNTDDWRYIYTEHDATEHAISLDDSDDADLIPRRTDDTDLILPAPRKYPPSSCERLFHMFWTGPFTDKPYLALLSFLYTQNTGVHLKDSTSACRPQFWLWINPGPAASVPNPSAHQEMYAQLKSSPWASPFLHPRFKDVIKFKLWNTTEQLDGVPEIADEWRSFKTLFNSGGHVISVPRGDADTPGGPDQDLLKRTGSKSSSSYDRLSVILSDMARFILCHRFGGIYLDADTILLRDWEELWGWRGAFAYRWSRLDKYNTAVLKMHKGSALGTFLFRTALKNGLDFHPMSVSSYTADAYLDPLLLRLPDALFDAAWLNTESYQRDRPPQPYFTEFADFFDTPTQNSAAPQALGFDGFFKGAYSYHFHNFWWKPFDPSRNWPDLGPRFKAGEAAARAALRAEKASASASTSAPHWHDEHGDIAFDDDDDDDERDSEPDKRDLDWSTVLKRTFEAYVRGERPNMYGEWLVW